jgi:hypothetical protein
MKDVVNQRQKLLEAFEAGFRQEIFKFDQPISPATLVPEVGDFRRFVQTKVLEARIAELAGRPGDALQGLLELESNIVKYAGSGGGLINMLTAIACAQVLNEAVEDLLAHATLEVQALKAAQRNYDIGEWLTSSAQIAFRYEFHFACNSIDLILDSPEQLMGDFTQEKSLIAKWKNRKNRARMDYLFKVNQTKNDFFRVYAEIIRELPEPTVKREFTSFEQLTAEVSQEGYQRFLTRNVVGRLLTAILLPAIDRVVERVDIIQARCSASRLAIGLKAYYIDHQELPDRLGDLMPDYIHAIPVDSFDGESLRYDKEQAIIYSVGSDFIDRGGSDLPFRFELEEDDTDDEAENDETEPTFPLRFAM